MLAGVRCALLLLCCAAPPCVAQRQAVLAQIDLPHPYYYREMYLPQLTAGPSSLAWSPDSKALVYSMAGSLWRQSLEEVSAQQLTGAAGYDYQPDWSGEGRWVIYCSYRDDAVELWALDLQSGASHALTANGAVNVEPRFSPDGKRIVFVSTLYQKHFHIFTADFSGGRLANITRLTGETKSTLPRYYYSPYDHEISPVWSADGRDVLYVSNRGHIYGSGGIWRVQAGSVAGSEDVASDRAESPREIHYEETNWRARPDVSPDGSRLVFSSYEGRSWHNLWLLPATGGDAFPLAYGDWDQTNARWSPDGASIAFIENRDGGTQIAVVKVLGGTIRRIAPPTRRYLQPMARLHLNIVDAHHQPAAARIGITAAGGRFYAPANAWIHADDGYDRRQQSFEAHYFHAGGDQWIDVPAGDLQIDMLHGFERKFEQVRVRTSAGQTADLTLDVDADAWTVPDSGFWSSADVHVHMNYGGTYRNTPAHLVEQASAEHLHLVNSLIVNKEQRFPDIAYDGARRDAASRPDAIVLHGQEYHTSYWGHLGLLNIDAVILPGYAGYPNTAAASLYPMNADIADIAHGRGALVGYVHPFDDYPDPIRKPQEPISCELPVDVALGKVDYMEILGFSDHRATAAVWYRLLNLGYRIPAAGGTDAMANFASLRGPVGMNRVYARTDSAEAAPQEWLDALKAGRTFATNGPLLGFSLGGAQIGDQLDFKTAQPRVAFSARLRSIVAVDHLELVCNGKVIKRFHAGRFHAGRLHPGSFTSGVFAGSLALQDSGWCVLRASSDGARYPVLDNYVYATTSPIYVRIKDRAPYSAADARYFAAWIDRVIETTAAYPDWNNAAEKRGVLATLHAAKDKFEPPQ